MNEKIVKTVLNSEDGKFYAVCGLQAISEGFDSEEELQKSISCNTLEYAARVAVAIMMTLSEQQKEEINNELNKINKIEK